MTTNGPSAGVGPGKAEDKDEWADLAKMYFQLTTIPTIPPINTMLRLIDKRWPLSKATSIFDTGCGPGPVISKLLDDLGDQIPQTTALRAADFSAAMVEQLRKAKAARISEGHDIWKRLQTDVLDAQDLKGIEDNSVSHVTAGFVLMLVPEPRKALAETLRVLTDEGEGGVLALSCWKGSEWIDLMGLVSKVRPDKPDLGIPQVWRSVDGVKSELEAAGFLDVEAEEVETEMGFETHEKIVRFFMEKLPNMRKAQEDMSEEEISKLQQLMLEQIKTIHPVAPGKMKGTAIVAAGRKQPKGRR